MKAWEPGWAIAVTTWTMGVNVRAASWPHMGGGAIGASQRVNFLWDETLSLPHVLCWPTSTGQQQTDSGSMSIDILTGIWQGVILASWRQPVVRW